MKEIKLTDLGQLKNELAKYKKGKKIEIWLFNQVARLAWLSKIVLCPLDRDDPGCKAWLLYMRPLEGLERELIHVDEEANGMPFASQIHILDAEQGEALAASSRKGWSSGCEIFRRSTSAISISRNFSAAANHRDARGFHRGRAGPVAGIYRRRRRGGFRFAQRALWLERWISLRSIHPTMLAGRAVGFAALNPPYGLILDLCALH